VSPGRLSPRALLLVALLAAVTRLAFEVQVRGDAGPAGNLARSLVGDERSYDRTARAFAAGTLERERAFYQEPLYPFLLSLAYRVVPPPPLPDEDPDAPFAPVQVAVIVVQHVLGVLTCLAVSLLGARALSPRAGLLAGLLAALSGPLVFAESQLLKEGAALLLWTVALHLWLDVLEDRGRRRAVALGVALGAGVLLRGNTYLLLGLVLLSLLARVGGRRRLAEAGLVLVCALLALSPATLHNLRRGELVLSTYQGGSNAALGMPDDPTVWKGVLYVPLRAGHADARYEEQDAVELAQAAEGRRLSGPEVSRHWWRRALDVVAARPGVAAQRIALKLLFTFSPDEVPDVKDWIFVRGTVPWLATPLSDLTLWGPLALLGLALLPWRGTGLLVVRGSVLAVMLSLVLFYVMGRYRLSATPGLWILAAGALLAGWERVAVARGARRALVAAGLLLLAGGAVAAGQLPLRPDVGGLQTCWQNVALLDMGQAHRMTDPVAAAARRDEAVDAAREALRLAPLYPEGRAMLVRALEMSTPVLPPRQPEAETESLRLLLVVESLRAAAGDPTPLLAADRDEQLAAAAALRQRPSAPGRDAFVDSLLVFAAQHVAASLREERWLPLALALADEAHRRDPTDGTGLALQGLVHKRLGHLAEAEACYRAALAAGGESVELLNNLGNLLLQTGRGPEAVPLLQRALELEPGNPVVLHNMERARSGVAPDSATPAAGPPR
jgi:4-amino-4-deoxy-L-arabinose transferase-like glycosyltransferase